MYSNCLQDFEVSTITHTNIYQVLPKFDVSATADITALCIHQMFEEQAERSPDAIAVVFENQQLTYQQLNQRANQLAHYLQKLGVGPEVLVSICMERSLEMIVGILGILKTGGAYVPIDPAYPQERITFILNDTRTPAILTTKKLVNHLTNNPAQVICLDTDWENIAHNSPENPISEATADNLSYIIYTSGSTGTPKGVMITHHGVCNTIRWRQKTFNLTPQDKVLQTISFSFDPSVWQIFWPLLFGAQLVIASPDGHRDTAYLVKMIIEQQITVLALVPSLMRLLLEEKEFKNCQCLRHVTSGGEALPVELINSFFERLKLDNILVNCYGPTEASIDATFWICKPDTNYTVAPIGRPINNTQIYILDEDLYPVPAGESGELYIGGVGLARGYLNNPQLTKQKFIPHPFSSQPGARLYKTGDLARYLPDGKIEFLGRLDHQVKIRGFRIDLGEIEAVLNQHPDVSQTVVVAREDVPSDQRLVAYIVPSQEKAVPSVSHIRHLLSNKLPQYMIPSAFVFLGTLPLTANGKVDRRALPTPGLFRQPPTTAYLTPRNEVERQLVQIWQQILGIEFIGVRDNFFELGGHSTLAVKMFWQIEQIFGKKLPLAMLFQSGTIEALANIITHEDCGAIAQQEKSLPSLVALQPNGSKRPLFFVHGSGGYVFCFRELAKYLDSDRPFYGLQAQGLDGKQPFLTRLEDIAARYIQEIRNIQPHGPYLIGGYSFGGYVAFEMAQQLYQQGEEIANLILLDVGRPGFQPDLPLPLMPRIAYHLDHLVKKGPSYLWEKAGVLSQRVKDSFIKATRHRANRCKDVLIESHDLLHTTQQLRETEQQIGIADANIQAAKNYKFQVYPGRAVLLRTDEQYHADHRDANAAQLRWSDLVSGGLETEFIPGSHDSLLEEPCIQVVAAKLQKYL